MKYVFDVFLKNLSLLDNTPVVLFSSKDMVTITDVLTRVRGLGFFVEKIEIDAVTSKILEYDLFAQKKHLFWLEIQQSIGSKQLGYLESCIEQRKRLQAQCFLLISGNISPDLETMISKHGLVVKDPPSSFRNTQTQVEKWIIEYVRERGVACDSAAARLLTNEFAANRSLIQGELEKLLLFCHGTTITVQAIKQLIIAMPKTPFFELYDAIMQHNRTRIVFLLNRLYQEEVHPLQIIRYVRNHIRQDLLQNNTTAKQSLLLPKLSALDALELRLKNQSLDEALALEMVFVRL